MSERWMLRGTQFANCNCAWGCPCQFNAPTTHGHCEAIEAGHIEGLRSGNQTQNRARQRRFPAAALPDEAHGLPLLKRQIDPVDCLDRWKFSPTDCTD